MLRFPLFLAVLSVWCMQVLATSSESRATANSSNSSYDKYNMRVHRMLERKVMPAFSAQPRRLEVDYEFYLDSQGRVTTLKTHAKEGGKWAEQTIAHSINA